MLHIVLHSSRRGHHCQERGFATAAEVHGCKRSFLAPLSWQWGIPPPATSALWPCEPRTPLRSTFQLVAHPEPSARPASALLSSPTVQRDSLRTPQQAPRCVPAGPEPRRAASAPRNRLLLANSVLPATRIRDRHPNAARAVRDCPKAAQE